MINFTQPEPTYLCTNADCHDREWNLVRLERGLWRLRSSRGVYTMGSSQPACPLCGASLLEIVAIQPNLERDASRAPYSNEAAPDPKHSRSSELEAQP